MPRFMQRQEQTARSNTIFTKLLINNFKWLAFTRPSKINILENCPSEILKVIAQPYTPINLRNLQGSQKELNTKLREAFHDLLPGTSLNNQVINIFDKRIQSMEQTKKHQASVHARVVQRT